jgi:hypothetical protein
LLSPNRSGGFVGFVSKENSTLYPSSSSSLYHNINHANSKQTIIVGFRKKVPCVAGPWTPEGEVAQEGRKKEKRSNH